MLFIDALDNLSSADDAHRMDWLPSQVSQNVKIIVSADADSTTLWRMRSKITDTERYYVHVKPLDRPTCYKVGQPYHSVSITEYATSTTFSSVRINRGIQNLSRIDGDRVTEMSGMACRG